MDIRWKSKDIQWIASGYPVVIQWLSGGYPVVMLWISGVYPVGTHIFGARESDVTAASGFPMGIEGYPVRTRV